MGKAQADFPKESNHLETGSRGSLTASPVPQKIHRIPEPMRFDLRFQLHTFVACLLLTMPATQIAAQEHPAILASRVCYVTDAGIIGQSGEINERVIQSMVDSLLLELTGRKDVLTAWRSILRPNDIVGIKVSASGRRVSGTRTATAMAVVRALRDAGFPRNQIVIWDRSREDLLAAGFSTSHPDYELDWVDPLDGYDTESPVSSPLLGRLIWGDSKFSPLSSRRFSDLATGPQQMSSQSHYARVLSKRVTRIIHIPSLQDSIQTGINGALAGMVIHNLDNWRRFTIPPNFGDPYLAEIYLEDMISKKVVLTILDGLSLQYAGGPFPSPANTIEHWTLYASYDPVAIDFTARRLIDEARVIHKLPSIAPRTTYIESAAAYGIGIAEESKIHMQRAPYPP